MQQQKYINLLQQYQLYPKSVSLFSNRNYFLQAVSMFPLIRDFYFYFN